MGDREGVAGLVDGERGIGGRLARPITSVRRGEQSLSSIPCPGLRHCPVYPGNPGIRNGSPGQAGG